MTDIAIEYVDRLSYTAGFLEADGCFHITNTSVGLRISNKHMPTLQRFQSWYGGTINSKGTPRDCYEWNLFGPAATALTRELLPYLFMKKREGEVLIKYHETIGVRGVKVTEEVKEMRTALAQEMKTCRISR